MTRFRSTCRGFPTIVLSCLVALCVSASLPAEQASVKRPNFVFFLIDDMGWTDAGCYGSKLYETPAIDRLAAGGMRFTDAYAACPVCSPTRASVMTGKYPARLKITNYGSKPLPPKEVTIARALKESGYTTFFAGKWHIGGAKEHLPDRKGLSLTVSRNLIDSSVNRSVRYSPAGPSGSCGFLYGAK